MKTEQHSEQSMQEEQIREAFNSHRRASAAGDANAEHDIYDDDTLSGFHDEPSFAQADGTAAS